jgi:ERF superfamily
MKSESIKEIATALSKAQGQMTGAVKDSENPFFKSKYADLASVVEAIREAFSKNGLSYIQTVEPSEKDEVRVKTILMHASGEWLDCGILAVPVTKQDAQGFGSALTYARRYSLSAACGVAALDDDGNAAAAAKPAKPKMAETVVLDFEVKLTEADTLASLKDTFLIACKESFGDPALIKKFTALKDTRKAALEKM